MGFEPNFDNTVENIQNDVARFERELELAKKFSGVWEDENFQEAVMDSVFGNEAEKLAVSLLDVGMTDSRAQEILFELKSLRFVRELLVRKSNDLDKVKANLKEANKLLLGVMSSNKD